MQFNRLKRRDFIMLLGGAAAWPRTLIAQGNDRARRIGVLMELAASDPQARSNVAAFQQGLYKLGWSQGGNLGIDYRWAPDDAVLVWKFAKELVELRPDVIVAHSSPVVATLLGQTRNIPIVFVSISDPIGEGFVASFARPGGNVTGFTNWHRVRRRRGQRGGGYQGARRRQDQPDRQRRNFESDHGASRRPTSDRPERTHCGPRRIRVVVDAGDFRGDSASRHSLSHPGVC